MENKVPFEVIAAAIRYIKANYTEQPNLEEVAAHVHLSKFHLQRLFKQWAGVSPKEFLQHTTLEKAKAALLKGQSTLATAHEVGLSGNGRLHDLFVKIEGVTPGEFSKKGKAIALHIDEIQTPFGIAQVAETERGIANLAYVDQVEFRSQITERYPKATIQKGLRKNGQAVQRYFQHWKIPKEKIGLDLQGTPFQIQVWKALLQIPSAQLLAYQDIAHLIGRSKAVRAVGTAIGKNPIAYLIPCHRVIKSNGDMGNYRWLEERKIAINGFEQLSQRHQ